MTNSPVIRAQNLSKTYHDGWMAKRDIQALAGVSFDVRPGEVFGLLGPNGAGKTTFIKILLGIVRQTGGEASLLGHQVGDARGRAKVGYLPERLVVPKHHTAYTALEYYGQLSGMTLAEVEARRGDVLNLVGLSDRAGDLASKYSKGMQQRLGLGQALMHNPDVLILDEPTDGLDPVGRAQVRRILDRLRDEGKTIFLNSHLLQEVELICDRVAILDKGQLKRVGPVDEMTSDTGDEQPAERQEKKKRVIQVEMEVVGEEEAIRRAIGDHPLPEWRVVTPGRIRLTTILDDQAAVDGLIDALRTAGVSIVRLTPHRASLEDVFLAAVSSESGDGSPATVPQANPPAGKRTGKNK